VAVWLGVAVDVRVAVLDSACAETTEYASCSRRPARVVAAIAASTVSLAVGADIAHLLKDDSGVFLRVRDCGSRGHLSTVALA
jgi:hypothetical protein